MTDEEKIAYLESQLSKVIDHIHDLEALVLQLRIGKTSKNSHKSPSSDLSRKNQSLRPKSDKPVGGQPNHEGTTLKMSQTPDKVVALRSDFCSRCGQNLTSSEFTLTARRQVIDIPPILPFTTEYQCYATDCSCGLFPFLYHKDVPFENNGSERAIRMIKVKTKISGQFKALQQQFAIIRSIIDTAIKNGQSVYDVITAVVNCHPKAAE